MGTYLATGIVQKMYIRKQEMEDKNLTIEDVQKALQKELNLDHYLSGDDETTISWSLKPQILEGNFPEFLETQFKMYDETKENDIQKVITKVREAGTGENIIKLAKSKSLVDFQMVDYILEPLKVERQDGFSDHITVNYHMMAFFIDGKIIMECYRNILRYFERNIRLQEKTYPVVACLKTMIRS